MKRKKMTDSEFLEWAALLVSNLVEEAYEGYSAPTLYRRAIKRLREMAAKKKLKATRAT